MPPPLIVWTQGGVLIAYQALARNNLSYPTYYYTTDLLTYPRPGCRFNLCAYCLSIYQYIEDQYINLEEKHQVTLKVSRHLPSTP